MRIFLFLLGSQNDQNLNQNLSSSRHLEENLEQMGEDFFKLQKTKNSVCANFKKISPNIKNI